VQVQIVINKKKGPNNLGQQWKFSFPKIGSAFPRFNAKMYFTKG
jgi:hypothetical protein